MEKHFWVVAYDISDDRRRTRLHITLLGYGTPVQFSLFECWLSAAEAQKMKQAVAKIIRPRVDHVRFYALCAACASKVSITQAGKQTQVQEAMVV